MADDEQFSLCWNNFNSNLSAGFHESLCRGDLVDVTLAAEGQFVKAHRLVLSVCSPYFRKMFTQMPANQHAFVFLKDVSHTALKDLIQFMYCGEVNVKQEALPAFISTAEALQIKGLTDSDPPSQSPAEPSTPQPQMQQQQLSSPRVRQRTTTGRSTYKIDAIDENGDKIQQQPTQIVIQTTAAPQQQTINQQHIQTIQQQQHVAAPIVSTSTGTTTATVVTHKRTAQRSSIGGVQAPHIKRTKSTTIDPLEVAEMQATTTTTTGSNQQQHQQQQITVQTTVIPSSAVAEAKASAAAAAASDTEYIDLPMEMPTKAEPDYADEAGDVGDGTDNDGAGYVEDDSYGEMRYDETYFTENDDGPTTATAAITTGSGGGGAATSVAGGGAATTSKAVVVKQQQASFSDSSYADAGDQSNNDAQVELLRKRRGRPKMPKRKAAHQSLEERFKAITETQQEFAVPAVYASTTKGGMKLIYQGHHFKYSYRKGQYSIFQCCYKENKEQCKVKVLSDQKRIYPYEGEHVHFVQATDKSVTDNFTFEPAALQDEEPSQQQQDDITYIELQNAADVQHVTLRLPENEAVNTESYEIYETTYLKNSPEIVEANAGDDELRNMNVVDNSDDTNDFREKIKQRLQKALMSKKK